MKATLNKVAEKDKYPCLKIIRDHVESESYVILFVTTKCGMVVYAGESSPYTLGHYSTSWMENMFKDLPSGTSVNIKV